MWENEDLRGFPKYAPSKPLCNDVGCATQVWDESQRPNMDDYLEMREFVPPKGTEVIPKEEFMKELDGKPHKVVFDIPNCKVSYKDSNIVVDELTGLSTNMIRTNIPTDDADFKRLSEETAKALEKSCNDYLETLSEVSKSLNPCLERLIAHFGKTSKRKARKHYKPKFTL